MGYLIIVYVLSVLITGAGAIWLLRRELEEDRRRIRMNYELEVTWLNVICGFFGVFIPIFNTMASLVILAALLNRPVITKRK